MKIEITYPAIVVTTTDTPVTDIPVLDACIGIKDNSIELCNFLSHALLDLGITAGRIAIIQGKTKGEIYSKIIYQSEKKLNNKQFEQLIHETNNQMLDGYGEELWKFHYKNHVYFIHLCSTIDDIPIHATQTPTTPKTKRIRRSPIFNAIEKRDLKKIRTFYQKQHLDQIDQYGYPPLWHAISAELHDIAIEMIHTGAHITIEKASLLTACAMNHSYEYAGLIHLAELLIAKGVDVNQADVSNYEYDPNAGFTPLMWAANRGKKPLVELLIAHGADINQQSIEGETALSATAPEYLEIVQFLLESGSNPHLLNNQEKHAVAQALWQADCEKEQERLYPRVNSPSNTDRSILYRKKATMIEKYM